jgi:hypothetical protein
MSAAHSLITACCCAIVEAVESNTMAPIAKIYFCIGCPLIGFDELRAFAKGGARPWLTSIGAQWLVSKIVPMLTA